MTDKLWLKWGTLKGWELESEASKAAAEAYLVSGEHSLAAMQQHDTDEQRELLCRVADAVEAQGGIIKNDWSGEIMTAAEARRYVMEYPVR